MRLVRLCRNMREDAQPDPTECRREGLGPGQRSRDTVTDFEYVERVSRERAAERLADIAYALAGGDTLELRHEGEQVKVPVADEVLLIHAGASNGDRVEVAIQLSWSSAASRSSASRR
jgi:amphi-Trp domain-containing protein